MLDFDGDLYGERVALDFVAHLREMRKYEGPEQLVEQIALDVEQTRAMLSSDHAAGCTNRTKPSKTHAGGVVAGNARSDW